MESPKPECAKCGIREKICASPQGEGPVFCPTIHRKKVVEKATSQYSNPAVREFARQASIQEAECYAERNRTPYVLHPVKTRVQETCEFAKKMGFKKLGIAFCAGLPREARALAEILEAQGFGVVSVVCKAGCSSKEILGIQENQKIHIGKFESMCSPIAQAFILNEEKTDFNILVGLCVGHDSLFLKHANAYSTVLVAKDRVLAHNPVAALHTSYSYYRRLLREGF
jgi:uncharacterized metal-binding protein